MNACRKLMVVSATMFGLALPAIALGPNRSLDAAQRRGQERVGAEENLEVLTRGPVHEAFAEPVVFDPEPGFIVSSDPPEVIDEIPPTQRPAGENVVWIPGYWNWDDERDDFIWVSGIWRVVPPGLEWVPGYWVEVRGGLQWTAGFWRSLEAEAELTYLPEPPATLEEGPIGDAPSADHIWVTGTWMWHTNRYAWRPGYWVHARPGWIWSPAHYVWSPSGYIFVDGFWDYSIRRRGLLFAPVYFHKPIYYAQVFSPTVVIDIDIFTHHLFVSHRHHHYFFGDYYAAPYFSAGIYPWFAFHMSHYGYDPIFAYYHWHYSRSDRDWDRRLRDDFRHRRDREDARPPRTFADMKRLSDRRTRGTENLALATSLDSFAGRNDAPLKLEKVSDKKRDEIKAETKKLREFGDKRVKLEKEKAGKGAIESKQAVKLDLAKSPVAVKSTVAVQDKPPEKPDTPKVDSDKEPKTRGDAKSRKEPKIDADTKERPKEKARPDRPSDTQPKEKTKPEPKEKAKPEPNEKAKPDRPKRTDPEPKAKGERDRPSREPREKVKPDRPKSESRPTETPRPKAESEPKEKVKPDRPKAESEPKEKAKPEKPRADKEPREKLRAEPRGKPEGKPKSDRSKDKDDDGKKKP
jgi:hypothetical protein